MDNTERCKEIERSIVTKKYKKSIWRRFTKAINEYDMIQEGDRIAVCISGGKDSMLMAKLFQELARQSKIQFELVFLVMNPGYNEANMQRIRDNAELLNIPITVFETDIFDVAAAQEQTPCYLCARMRRGHLYAKAEELGCNKIALGHHYDDVIETILMGMLYGGQIQTMMPKLFSTNFEGMELIRPMYLIREQAIIEWSAHNGLEFIRCACKLTERRDSVDGTGEGSKRDAVKKLIRELEEDNSFVPANIFRSVENVNLSTVVAYKKDGVRHHFLDDYEQMREAIKAKKTENDDDYYAYYDYGDESNSDTQLIQEDAKEEIVLGVFYQSIVTKVLEIQKKLGYEREIVRIFYELEELNAIMGWGHTEIEPCLEQLKNECASTFTPLGELRLIARGDRIQVVVPEEGSEYVHGLL